jgi:hypothetical protein
VPWIAIVSANAIPNLSTSINFLCTIIAVPLQGIGASMFNGSVQVSDAVEHGWAVRCKLAVFALVALLHHYTWARRLSLSCL